MSEEKIEKLTPEQIAAHEYQTRKVQEALGALAAKKNALLCQAFDDVLGAGEWDVTDPALQARVTSRVKGTPDSPDYRETVVLDGQNLLTFGPMRREIIKNLKHTKQRIKLDQSVEALWKEW